MAIQPYRLALTPRSSSHLGEAHFSATLLELYRLSYMAPMQHFQRLALELVGQYLDFDSAWWGMASQPPLGEIEIHASLPYGLPDFYPSLWEHIKEEDSIAEAVMLQPGTTVNFDRDRLYATAGLASLMQRFGITQCLCTVTLLPELNLMAFLSLYRVAGKPSFTERERKAKQMLMPHLTSALSTNWMMHLERVHVTRNAGHAALGVVDRRGMLYVADPALTTALRLEWPHWVGPQLPDVLLQHIRGQTPFIGAHLNVRLHPAGNLWLIDLRLNSAEQRLSSREAQIAHLFAMGKSHKEVARVLDIAPNTVRHHLREVYIKLGVSDKAALAQKLLPEQTAAAVDVGEWQSYEEWPWSESRWRHRLEELLGHEVVKTVTPG